MDTDEPTAVALTVSADAWLDLLAEADKSPDALAAWIERIARAALDRGTDAAWLKAGEISLLLSDDREIRELNATYRQKDRATNVLSFPGLDLVDGQAEGGRPLGLVALGDVVISRERLFAEADELKKTPADHFAHLLVHGILHLLGYDHDDDRRAQTMETLEAEILKVLGFAPPYAPADNVDDGCLALRAVP